jgi:hypothetical protein
MTTKPRTKTFDCVDMKHKAQEALVKEFQSRRDEFATLSGFLNAKVRESKRAMEIWSRFGGNRL